MKIVNRTHWRTDHLAAIARLVAQDELDPEHRKRFIIEVVYGHRGRISGWAYYHRAYARIKVGSDRINQVDLALVLAHEMAHSRGVRHRDMKGSARYQWVDGHREHYAWAEGYPLERRAAPPKPTLDERRTARLDHALRMLAAWTRKAKAAETRRKGWARRAKDIERQMQRAAVATPSAPEGRS